MSEDRTALKHLMDICEMRISDETLLNGLTMGEAREIVAAVVAIANLHNATGKVLVRMSEGAK